MENNTVFFSYFLLWRLEFCSLKSLIHWEITCVFAVRESFNFTTLFVDIRVSPVMFSKQLFPPCWMVLAPMSRNRISHVWQSISPFSVQLYRWMHLMYVCCQSGANCEMRKMAYHQITSSTPLALLDFISTLIQWIAPFPVAHHLQWDKSWSVQTSEASQTQKETNVLLNWQNQQVRGEDVISVKSWLDERKEIQMKGRKGKFI